MNNLILIVVFLCLVSYNVAFVIPSMISKRVSTSSSSNFILQAEKNTFGSKLLPQYSEEELSAFLKEFNITNFDLQNDPELNKWSPSKEFFEKFGFQNNTVRYQRKVMDVKIDFYSAYTKPILPQYKTFIADLMSVTFIQIVDSRYQYDALHAFGLCTQYYTVMKGYPLTDEVSFNSRYDLIIYLNNSFL